VAEGANLKVAEWATLGVLGVGHPWGGRWRPPLGWQVEATLGVAGGGHPRGGRRRPPSGWKKGATLRVEGGATLRVEGVKIKVVKWV
jgi:hypothetical protein